MSPKIRLQPNQLAVEDGWRLIRWCAATGSNEFSFSCLSAATQQGRFCVAAEEALTSLAVGFDERPSLTRAKDRGFTRRVKLWRLNEESLRVLELLLPDGIFTDHQGSDDGWIEDITFYQGGQLRLAVITHERMATILVSDSEQSELQRLGIIPGRPDA